MKKKNPRDCSYENRRPGAGEEDGIETPASIAGRMRDDDMKFQLAMDAAGYRRTAPTAGAGSIGSVLRSYAAATYVATNSSLADC